MKRPMNVLMIVMDQFRADLLSANPLGQIARLPRLRALQKEAVTFRNHHSVVSPCGPSRVSLLTGQYAMNHRAVRNGTPLRHDTPNIATVARSVGYDAGLYGYTDTAHDPRVLDPDDPRLFSYEELMPGFREAVQMRMEGGDTAWREHLATKGTKLPPYPDTYASQDGHITGPALYSAEDSDTAFLTDRFVEDLRKAKPGWFSLLTYIRPHPPLVAPEPYNTMYDPGDMPETLQATAEQGDRLWHPFLAPAQDRQTPSSMVVGCEASYEDTSLLRAVYLGLASEVDHHIGRVIDTLKAVGEWDNTFLIVTADHGEMLGDYGLWGKGTFHEAAFHVPLIIRDPCRPDTHGQTVSAMTESIDIAPTILEFLGATVPDSINGTSLTALLEDVTTGGRETSMSEFDFGNPVKPTLWMKQLGIRSETANLSIMRTERHRLVCFGCDLPPVLFDMSKEKERRDLACDAESLPLLLDLTSQLLRHRMTHGDSLFSKTIIGRDGVIRGSH